MECEFTLTHILSVEAGSRILCRDGVKRIIGKGDIKYGFMGKTIFGDCYNLGQVPVILIK